MGFSVVYVAVLTKIVKLVKNLVTYSSFPAGGTVNA